MLSWRKLYLQASSGEELEKPNSLSVIPDIDCLSRRRARQARHGHDVTTDYDDETRTSG